jgi:putative ATPase
MILCLLIIICFIENPSFEVNSALLSRCRVFVLQKLQPPHIKQILQNAICKHNDQNLTKNENNNNTKRILTVEEEVLDILAESADGDARTALNILDRMSFSLSLLLSFSRNKY